MLSVQSSINQTSFGQAHRRALTPEERQMIAEQQEMLRERNEILRQKFELEAMANDNSTPSAMKKIAKAGALLTAGAAVGLTAGGGTKILINKAKAFKNSDFVKKFGEYYSSFKNFASESLKSIKDNFKKSDIYKKPADSIKAKYDKFAENKYGKKIVDFCATVKNMVEAGLQKVKEGKDFIMRKLKAVKSETYENAAVGTVGTSSGICAAVNSLKNGSEAGEQ